MTFNKEDRIKTKECWSDVYLNNANHVYVVEDIGDDVARIRGTYGTVIELTKKTLYEIFTNAL